MNKQRNDNKKANVLTRWPIAYIALGVVLQCVAHILKIAVIHNAVLLLGLILVITGACIWVRNEKKS